MLVQEPVLVSKPNVVHHREAERGGLGQYLPNLENGQPLRGASQFGLQDRSRKCLRKHQTLHWRIKSAFDSPAFQILVSQSAPQFSNFGSFFSHLIHSRP